MSLHTFVTASDEIISSQLKKMEQSFKKIKDEVKRHKPQDADDRFAVKMKDFLSQSEDRFRRVSDQQKLMDEKFKEITTYYCMDDKKTTMEEFFGDLSHFLKEFEVCYLWCRVLISYSMFFNFSEPKMKMLKSRSS